jgi:hypothetical protein
MWSALAVPDDLQEARAISTAKNPASVSVVLRVVTVGLVVGALSLVGGEARQAQAQTPIIVGFDMNTQGNSCLGGGCVLGPIDHCVHVPTGGGSITFDVFLDNLPHMDGQPYVGGITSFIYYVGEEQGRVVGTVTGYTHTDSAVNLMFARPFDVPQDHSDVVGTAVPLWKALVVDLGDTEFNPPYTRGVLSRLTVDTTGTSDGLYGLTIEPEWENYISVGDAAADNYCNPDDGGDGPDPFQAGCDILDAHDGYGLIAIGAACAAGGIAELPEVSGSSHPPYAAFAVGLAGTLLALSAGAWYARRRRLT